MAGISTGGGHGGKKAVDSEIPLVPFIDLLLCCIMFLLVTAVWNQLSSLDAHLPEQGQTGMDGIVETDTHPLSVLIDREGFRLSTDLGDETRIGLASNGEHDLEALREHLQHRRSVDPNDSQVVMSADDGIHYAEVVQTMDVFAGTGYQNVTVAGGI